MAGNSSNTKRKGTIVCQDGEIDLEDPAVEEGFADMKAAIMTGRTDILRILLSAAQSYRDEEELFDGDDILEEGQKRVLADEEEVLDLLQMLLNFRDNDAGTGLHYATKLQRCDMVRSLLASGANPTLKNLEGATPYDYCKSDQMKTAYVGALMQAVAQSKLYRVNLLLQAGVDVNSGDDAESDNKVLHWAASFADIDTVKLLLGANADVNAVNSDGSTPLHDAVIRGDMEIIEELLKHGANVHIIPFKGRMEGKSCHDIAIDKEDIRTLLEVHLLTCEKPVSGDGSEGESTASPAIHTFESAITDGALPSISSLDFDQSKESEHLLGNTETSKFQLPIQSNFKPILLPPKSPMRLFLPTMMQLDPGVLQLWPPPRTILQYKGTSYVPPLQIVFMLMSTRNVESSHLAEFAKIIRVIEPNFESIGLTVEKGIASACSSSYVSPKGCIECFIDSSNLFCPEEYKLHVSTRKVRIIGSSIKSIFYAINTFLQCLRIFQGKAIPLLQISDAPDSKVRGFQFDFGDGDIPKFDNLLQFINILSGFKVNQIYVPAHYFLPDNKKRYAFYHQRDLFRLHDFCQERYIDVVPAFRSSDVFDQVNAYSYSFIKTDILTLFPDTRFLSISLNDSECFVKGSQGVLSGITDSELVTRIEELHVFCVSNGLTLMIDSELILQQPVKLQEMNQNLICLNLLHRGKEEVTCEYLTDLCMPNVVCPLYKDDRTIINDVRSSLMYFENSNLTRTSSIGMTVRLESKKSSLSCTTLDIVSAAIASGIAWRASSPVTLDESLVSNITNRHVYQDDSDNIGGLVLTLSSLEQVSLVSRPQIASTSSSPDQNTQWGQLKRLLNSTDDLAASSLSFENLKLTVVSLKQLESSLGKCKIKSPLKEMLLSEVSSILKILSFLCRVGLALQQNNADSKESNIGNLSQIKRSDLSNKLMNLLECYESYCTDFYKQTTEDMKSIELLKKLLKRLHPEKESSFLQSIARTFTV